MACTQHFNAGRCLPAGPGRDVLFNHLHQELIVGSGFPKLIDTPDKVLDSYERPRVRTFS